jgi:hypothetical protein
MNITTFLAEIDDKLPPARESDFRALESLLGASLPVDYREFLARCNGGHVGGRLWFKGPTTDGEVADAGVHHIGGFRSEAALSLEWNRDCYEGRIPQELMWIMDDPFGNAICLGIRDGAKGKVYFWDHENEPDEAWDGSLASAENVQLMADSFSDFVAGLTPTRSDDDA